jgi:hypothetical protein
VGCVAVAADLGGGVVGAVKFRAVCRKDEDERSYRGALSYFGFPCTVEIRQELVDGELSLVVTVEPEGTCAKK